MRSSEQENSIPYAQPFGVIDGSSETILEYIPALKSAFCAFIDRFSDVVVAIQVFIVKLRVDVMMDKLGFGGVFAQHPSIVLSTFSKVALHEQWRPPRRRFGVSFWELFLCAYCAKEKVDKR